MFRPERCVIVIVATAILHNTYIDRDCLHQVHNAASGREVKCDAEFYVANTPGPAMGLLSHRALQLATMHCDIWSKEHVSANTKKEDLLWSLWGHWQLRWWVPNNNRSICHPNRTTTKMSDSYAWRNQVWTRKHGVARSHQESDPTNRLGMSIVYSRKSSGQLRICLDQKDLNKAIKCPHYRTPIVDKLISAADRTAKQWSVTCQIKTITVL